jgi:hypothetical protein
VTILQEAIMPEASSHARTLKVFLASPSDVQEERAAMARLVRDINDVLAFLAPEKHLTLELVRYETHTFPDLGQPQEVINRQIPLDYDIFVGVMWSRCGTPTETDASGTIEEFRRAYERRKKGHLPRIMFYFCDQMIPIPDAEGLRQLAGVVEFRTELAKMGLTGSYPSHAEFSEYVRGGLLRAIRDTLIEEAGSTQAISTLLRPPAVLDSSAQADIQKLAADYEQIRRDMPPGGPRTLKMAALFSEMKTKAAGVQVLLEDFERSQSPGIRLAAIAILQMFPHAEHLDWLAERLDNPGLEQPFVGYQAAVGLLEAVRALASEECKRVRKALDRALSLAGKLPSDSDRILVLRSAEHEFNRRCQGKA